MRLDWIAVGVLASALVGCSGKTSESEEEACKSLEPPAAEQMTELRLTNRRAEPIFIGGGCGPALLLEQVGAMTAFAADTCDAPTCASVLKGDCSQACAACAPGVLRIEPGESYTQQWVGTVFAQTDVSATCSAGCTDACWQETQAPDGDYRLNVSVFLECPETVDDCTCPEGASPPCFIEAYDGTVNAESRSADFAMPNPGPVEIFVD